MNIKERSSFPDLNLVTGFKTNAEKYEPFAWYKKMRQEDPVHYNEAEDVWSVFKYEDVKRVAEDKEYFSNKVLAPPIIQDTIIFQDQPKHTIGRALLAKAFTPKAMSSWASRVDMIVQELMESIEGRIEIDMVQDFASPLPMIVISELLGVPTSDREQFRDWANTLTLAPQENTPEEYMRIYQLQAQASTQLVAYFQDIIELKRRNPADDIISDLTQAEEDGEKLSPDSLIASCVMLLIAGNETTTSLITNSIYTFNDYKLIKELAQHPQMIPSAVEEMLRYRSPLQRAIRKVLKRTEIGGKVLEPGDYVVNWIGSANRDENIFEEGDKFILGRKNNPHLALGKGIHFCMGSHLARMEAKAALTAMLTTYPGLQVHPEYEVDVNPSNVYGLKNLSIQLQD
ncbi:cytochrome P450 [Paenibacillus amylolyticus]|uniref:cytochrome P450 n=1 Tax=Paenibacillus amylolyticus TaxID=1451 RepID=UPI0039AF5D83